jgi:hypothetical protein
VSLILDALRKLERDRDAREPGVLVLGAVPWGGGPGPRRRRAALAAAAVLAALAAAGWWLLRPGPQPAAEPTAPPEAAVASTPEPSRHEPSPPPAAALPRATAPPAAAPAPRRLDLPEAPVPAAEVAAFPPTPEARPDAELRLNAISERDGRRVALIGDRLLFEGDSFDGVRVVRIGDAEVEVEVGGRLRVLAFR